MFYLKVHQFFEKLKITIFYWMGNAIKFKTKFLSHHLFNVGRFYKIENFLLPKPFDFWFIMFFILFNTSYLGSALNAHSF